MSGRSSVSGSSQSVCYKTAIRCISYLSSSHLVRRNKLISPATGNPVLIKKLLAAIDSSEVQTLDILGMLLLLLTLSMHVQEVVVVVLSVCLSVTL